MRYCLVVLVLVACSAGAETTTTGGPVPTLTPLLSTTVPNTATTVPPPPCPAPPYELNYLPPAVVAAEAEDTADEPDEFTSIGGTNVAVWVNSDNQTAIALVRGSLPPRDWPAERGEVEVAGSDGVAGPYPDGRWVVAWFNDPGERCDQYTMVFYPPVSPQEVEETLFEMARVAG